MGGGDFRKAFSTPIVIDAQGVPQILTSGSKAAYSYDPVSGRELWRFRHGGYSPAARPLFDHGFAFISTGNGAAEIVALSVDGHGDVTDTAAVWRVSHGPPRKPSPVMADGLLFMVNDGGIASCLETETGREVWRERIGGEYSASPILGDGRVYCFSQTGTTTVLAASKTFEVLATNQLGTGFMSSPAVAGRALFLRSKTALYRIEQAENN